MDPWKWCRRVAERRHRRKLSRHLYCHYHRSKNRRDYLEARRSAAERPARTNAAGEWQFAPLRQRSASIGPSDAVFADRRDRSEDEADSLEVSGEKRKRLFQSAHFQRSAFAKRQHAHLRGRFRTII